MMHHASRRGGSAAAAAMRQIHEEAGACWERSTHLPVSAKRLCPNEAFPVRVAAQHRDPNGVPSRVDGAPVRGEVARTHGRGGPRGFIIQNRRLKSRGHVWPARHVPLRLLCRQSCTRLIEAAPGGLRWLRQAKGSAPLSRLPALHAEGNAAVTDARVGLPHDLQRRCRGQLG